jgi:eukaryotic-like serine/threonine-protein kinase
MTRRLWWYRMTERKREGMGHPNTRRVYRFGGFEVDPDVGEVRKRGIRIRVQDQPLRLLNALLERPGVLITREELHRRLWPDDTFVDFEHGLNAAAARLRQALGDSAQTPRFIESVPRRGYRFIGAVKAGPTDWPEAPPPEEATRAAETLPPSDEAGTEPAVHVTPPDTVPKPAGHPILPWIIAGVFCAAAAMASWLHVRDRSGDLRPFQFSVLPPAGTTFALFDSAVVSPDGRLIVFPAVDDSGETHLWVRPLDALAATRLADTNGAGFPFWSPDSRTIAFFANGKLKRVDAGGGPSHVLCDAADGRGGTWNRQGVIVFAPGLTSPLFQVPSVGGEPKQVTFLDRSRQELSHRWPFFLPDGDHFLYTNRIARAEDYGLFVGSLSGGRATLLLRSPANAIYAGDPSGHGYVLFIKGNTLMGCLFDAGRLRMTGNPFPVADSINGAVYMEPLHAEFSASGNGVLVYRNTRRTDQLTWFDRNGVRIASASEPGIHLGISLSRDEKEITFSRMEPHTGVLDIWRMDVGSGMSFRVTYGPGDHGSPVWSPDGSRIAYGAYNNAAGALYESSSTGGGATRLLPQSANLKFPTDWSADGRFLLYQEIHPGANRDSWALPLPDGKPMPLLQSRFNVIDAVFSPNGKWFAYGSDETGKQEIYAAPFPPSSASTVKWMVSREGGAHPKWPGDGKQLYYLAPDKRIMVVEVATQRGFQSGPPRALFQSDIVGDFRARFAVTADGRRFLIPSAASQPGSPSATVVVNWPEGMR